MNGNTPYAGASSTLQAGTQFQQQREDFTLTAEQVDAVRDDIKRVAAGVRKHLPNGFEVTTVLDDVPQQGPVAQVFVIFPIGGQMGAMVPLTEAMFDDSDKNADTPYRVFDPEEAAMFQSQLAATAAQQLMQADSGKGPAQ